METHVVTVGLRYSEGYETILEMHEVFRGDEGECRKLCGSIAGASDDRRKLNHVFVQVGPIAEWEEHLRSV